MLINPILEELERDGMVIVPNVFSSEFMKQVATEIDKATAVCVKIQLQQRVGTEQEATEILEGGNGPLGGAAHHVVTFGGSFFELLKQEPLFDVVEQYLGGGPFILNSFGAVTNTNQRNMYEHGKTIHRDSRNFHPSFRQQCWFMVLVDDFTVENGATWMWRGSHTQHTVPDKDSF